MNTNVGGGLGARFMRRDHLSLDDLAAIDMAYPDRLSAAELRDVKEWFALRIRGWERNLLPETQRSSNADGSDEQRALLPPSGEQK